MIVCEEANKTAEKKIPQASNFLSIVIVFDKSNGDFELSLDYYGLSLLPTFDFQRLLETLKLYGELAFSVLFLVPFRALFQ